MQLSPQHKLMLAAVRSMLGELKIKVDRERQLVTINQNSRTENYTYEQLATIAEQLFPAD